MDVTWLAATGAVFGARFSGAGFRGCCLALIDPQAADDDEVEFEFDSDVGEITEGAVPIAPGFITRDEPEVTGEIFRVGDAEPLLAETVLCTDDD